MIAFSSSPHFSSVSGATQVHEVETAAPKRFVQVHNGYDLKKEFLSHNWNHAFHIQTILCLCGPPPQNFDYCNIVVLRTYSLKVS